MLKKGMILVLTLVLLASAVYAADVDFTGSFLDSGRDTDGDGKYNFLDINVNVNVNVAGEYDFSKESIMKNLGVCPKKIYQLLLDNPHQEYSREEIAEETGYSPGSGGFSNAISKLNSLRLIQKDNAHIKLNQDLLEI